MAATRGRILFSVTLVAMVLVSALTCPSRADVLVSTDGRQLVGEVEDPAATQHLRAVVSPERHGVKCLARLADSLPIRGLEAPLDAGPRLATLPLPVAR